MLGAKRRNLAGFSSTAAQPHQGFIFASDIIQETPPSLRGKAARLVGAKCTLLARIDAYGQVRGRGAAVLSRACCCSASCRPKKRGLPAPLVAVSPRRSPPRPSPPTARPPTRALTTACRTPAGLRGGR